MAPEAPTQTMPGLGTECPNCGAHADPGQLVCLECGARLALDYRRPRGWMPAAAVIGIVLLVAGAAFAITLVAVDDNSKDEVAATKAAKQGTAQPHKSGKARKPRAAAGPVASVWPKGRNGFTVVLLSSGNLTGARDFARDARRHGVHAGLLRSREYPSLAPGFWLVFSGVYKTRAQAQRASARLKHRYSGAYPQFVDGAKRKP